MGWILLLHTGTQSVTSKCFDGRFATLSIAVNTWSFCYPPVNVGDHRKGAGNV